MRFKLFTFRYFNINLRSRQFVSSSTYRETAVTGLSDF